MANESTGSVQDLTWSSSTWCSLLLPPALCTEGKTALGCGLTRPRSSLGPRQCTLHTQSGGWGQLQHKVPKSMAIMWS